MTTGQQTAAVLGQVTATLGMTKIIDLQALELLLLIYYLPYVFISMLCLHQTSPQTSLTHIFLRQCNRSSWRGIVERLPYFMYGDAIGPQQTFEIGSKMFFWVIKSSAIVPL